MILSYRLWQTEFGGDPTVIGRNLVTQVDSDDTPYTVIGVMPREFHFPKSDVLFWITTRFGEGATRRRSAPTTGWRRSDEFAGGRRSARRAPKWT